MNFLLAILLLGAMKIGSLTGIRLFTSNSFLDLTQLTLFLFFFNLLPVPPLDGAHVLRNLVGMSDEVYQQISRYSFMLFILVMRSDAVGNMLSTFSGMALDMLARLFGWELVPR